MTENKNNDWPQSDNQLKKSTAEVLELHQAISAIISNAENRIIQRREEFQNARECGARLTRHRFSY